MNDNTVVILDGKEYPLIKKGKAQADQVIKFTRWLSEYALPIFQGFATPDGSVPDMGYAELIAIILEKLSTEALVELFAVVVGCSSKTANQEFDIGVLIDSATVVWEHQPGLQRIVNRFFSTQGSQSTTAE